MSCSTSFISYGRAQSLNDRFVKPRAPFEVNVASHLKQMVAKTLKKVEEGENSISLDIFDKAQKVLYCVHPIVMAANLHRARRRS